MNKLLQQRHNKIHQIKQDMMQESLIVGTRLSFEMLVQEKRSY
ncbi:hypothetical protein [Shewanella frigidimarina]